MSEDFTTKAKITWCPGCPNAAILVAFRQALNELIQEGFLKPENLVAATGIGCHGKILDYLDVNSFTSLHGRLIPTMCGIKLANPELCVVGFSGDGDSYAEGLSHLIQAARRNSDVKIFIHNNQVFALTTGQATPTSPKDFKGASTPDGSTAEPLNPLRLMLAAGATFVARTYAPEITKTKEIMKAAILHQGFSFVDIIQPCLTFFDTRDYYQERIYWLEKGEKEKSEGDKIPLGIFYESG